MKAVVRRLVPLAVRTQIKKAVPAYWKCHCPICDHYDVEFKSFGLIPRQNARCPSCGALERHRLVWMFLRTLTDLFDGRPKRMLHVAPEPSLWPRLAAIPNIDYMSADLNKSYATTRLDITNMPGVASGSMDVVYCSHVLEHVSDDRMAMREFARVLKPSGWAVLLVPIWAEHTFEDPSVTDPKERERLFGQDDHVRRYGPDFADRVNEAGFDVRIYDAEEVLGEHRHRYAVPAHEGPVYFCRPRVTAQDGPSARSSPRA
jgi:SAM-dependent methyltransferase